MDKENKFISFKCVFYLFIFKIIFIYSQWFFSKEWNLKLEFRVQKVDMAEERETDLFLNFNFYSFIFISWRICSVRQFSCYLIFFLLHVFLLGFQKYRCAQSYYINQPSGATTCCINIQRKSFNTCIETPMELILKALGSYNVSLFKTKLMMI